MMYDTWAPLQAVLNNGPHYVLDNQKIWTDPIAEFNMACRISSPIRAEFYLAPQADSLLVRGNITGQVILPCVRCAEDTRFELDEHFDTFEPFPAADSAAGKPPDPELDEYFIRLSPLGASLEINLAALAWEEFAQALPGRPLCSPDCAGLCPKCGLNLNYAQCICAEENPDPRMAKLRGLKINQ
ncbi:MAG: DUF177 domain-containing protein [Deltaproteobacteria bacterium]|jgi:uncharacterized protein|nr:DUF177 domain-containing protein [Deltaproteobacteria bacterium]